MRSRLATIVAAILIGGAVGAASLVAVVNAATGPPGESPASVDTPAIDYGS